VTAKHLVRRRSDRGFDDEVGLVTGPLTETCPGVGQEADRTPSETVECPACGQCVNVLTSYMRGEPPVRTIVWHLAPLRTGR
jgi:hypothetical protein